MPSARDLERLLIEKFNEEQSISLKRALSELLEQQGLGRFEAAEEAEKMVPVVRDLLGRRPPEKLPFEFGRSDTMQLVGKSLSRSGESAQTRFARQARACVDDLHEALCRCADFDFEVVCAAALIKSGASTMVATCSGDDGGIDLYGRLPLRPPDSAVRPGLLQTTILATEILVLGQCKRYNRSARVGRPEIQQFLGSVRSCLRQYADNPRPPSRRVPPDFYRRDEVCIPVFMTTAQYADTSTGEAQSNDVILIEGSGLSQFLTAQRVGILDDVSSGQPIFDGGAFDAWLAEVRQQYRRQI